MRSGPSESMGSIPPSSHDAVNRSPRGCAVAAPTAPSSSGQKTCHSSNPRSNDIKVSPPCRSANLIAENDEKRPRAAPSPSVSRPDNSPPNQIPRGQRQTNHHPSAPNEPNAVVTKRSQTYPPPNAAKTPPTVYNETKPTNPPPLKRTQRSITKRSQNETRPRRDAKRTQRSRHETKPTHRETNPTDRHQTKPKWNPTVPEVEANSVSCRTRGTGAGRPTDGSVRPQASPGVSKRGAWADHSRRKRR